MRISDWSSDVCSSDLLKLAAGAVGVVFGDIGTSPLYAFRETFAGHHPLTLDAAHIMGVVSLMFWSMMIVVTLKYVRSEEHTSELQSLMRISYAVFCFKKKKLTTKSKVHILHYNIY